MKKAVIWICVLSLMLGLAGCGSKTNKILKEMEDRIFHYTWTSDDVEVLSELRYDEDMDAWADSVAQKIAADQYGYTEVGSLMSCLESAGYEHKGLLEESQKYTIRRLTALKQEAFATGDLQSVLDYLYEAEKYIDEVPVQSVVPYQELADFLVSLNGIQPITENGVGGYYDDKQDQYKNETQVDDNLTQTSRSYEFFGDFMMKAYSKKVYRPTGEQWEENLLSKYDFGSVGFYYKDTIVNLSASWIELYDQGQTYLIPNGEEYIACLITPDQILIIGYNHFIYE